MTNSFLSNLNAYQKLAVIDDSRACLVNAQVGSGKTTVLIAKILYLHYEIGIPFERMVVLTFTNKAANEIKERIKVTDPLVNEDDLLYFGTFHSVALKMLKTFLPIEQYGYTNDFSVIDPDEELEIATGIIDAKSLRIKYSNKLLKRLENALQGQNIYANMKKEDDIQRLLTMLHQERIKQNKMNFFDLISNATALLKESDYRAEWVIVDEFQDSDEKQLNYIKVIAKHDAKIFAVGDPNQVIYSWRGGKLNVFQKFSDEYKATVLTLPINYRSCSTILDAAKCFLGSNTNLTGIREQGSKIVVKNHYNSFIEAQYLSNRIREILAAGESYKDIAIFFRIQSQSSTLENVFSREGIPYDTSIRRTLMDIPVLGWLIRLMRFSLNTSDSASVKYVLSHTKYGEQLTTYDLRGVLNGKNTVKSSLFMKMKGFSDWCKTCDSIFDVYEYFQIDKYINPTSASFIEDKQLVLNLFQKIDDYIMMRKVSMYEGLMDFINSSALYGVNILNEDLGLDRDTVKLMTLHASKGLEFKYVFIIGANYGLIPLHTSSDAEREEEKRLFFVGITRAKDYLEITYYTNPDDQRVASGPSSYLSMIPAHLVEREEMSNDMVNLHALRKEVSNSKAPMINESENVNRGFRKISHQKYGIGIVINETEEAITARFDGYGDKEFIKMFSEFNDV